LNLSKDEWLNGGIHASVGTILPVDLWVIGVAEGYAVGRR
jgi:hypothetical protein